ncbi:unnamed protein product [Camellia sinensis]
MKQWIQNYERLLPQLRASCVPWIPYCRTQHGGTCMEKGATIPPNKETKLPCCSSLYRVPHISEEMGFLKVGAHKRYLRQCSVASEKQKRERMGLDHSQLVWIRGTTLMQQLKSWTSEWDQFEWSKRANHVSVRKQTK